MLVGRLPSAQTFSAMNDYDVVLEERDDPDFDEAWMRAHERVQAVRATRAFDEDALTRLRETVYLCTFDLTQSAELAADVSDDFGLLGEALALGVEDDWLSALARAYTNDQFPRGALVPVPDRLRDALQL